MDTPFEAELQLMCPMDFGKKFRKLAGVLALLVVAVRILSDACVSGGIVVVDGYGGNTQKPV